MKKMVFIACALMMVVTGSAMAAGTNLAWSDCVGGGGNTGDLAGTCTNLGLFGTLNVSFVPAVDLPALAASECFTDVQAPNSVSSWWNSAARFSHVSGFVNSGVCPGWFDGALSGPIAFAPVLTQLSASRLRVRTTIVIAAGEEQFIAADGTEWLSGQITVRKSAGTLNNAECNDGAAIGVANLTLLQPGGVDDTVLESADVSNCVTFRGGGGQICPGATPTTRATWGSIKALYR